MTRSSRPASPGSFRTSATCSATTPLFDESKVTDDATANALFGGSSALSDLRNRCLSTVSSPDLAETAIRAGQPRGRRQDDLLPPAQRHAADARGARSRRYRMGGACRGMFELLGWTQWLRNHVRPLALGRSTSARWSGRGGSADRSTRRSHTVDVRPPSQYEGWHNIPMSVFFLWRLRAIECARDCAQARRCRRFSLLFQSAGQFRAGIQPSAARTETRPALTSELHVPGPIRPALLLPDLSEALPHVCPVPGFSEFYGLFEPLPDSTSLRTQHDGLSSTASPVPVDSVRCRNL